MIAIHHRPGSFSDRWEEYCETHHAGYVAANLFDHDIVGNLRQQGVKGLLFHLTDHTSARTRLAAKSVCQALELCGIKVFPNHASYWHCDDKIAQHYLLESLGLPRCKTYVFYDKHAALEWVSQAQFPKVFKLRCGAGSTNVRLVRNRLEAERMVAQMFGRGLRATPGLFDDLATKKHKHNLKHDWTGCIRRLPASALSILAARFQVPRERGYAYFQDFLPDNSFDTRVTVIGNRAFAFRRFIRPRDFRASGSGRLDNNPDLIDLNMVRTAFEAAERIGAPCMAFDFVLDEDKSPVVLEMCHTFVAEAVFHCPGHWDRQLNFRPGHKWPEEAILEDFIESVQAAELAGPHELAIC